MILLANRKTTDYSRIKIILNYDDENIFNKQIQNVFIKNILKAIPRLQEENFLSIDNLKKKHSTLPENDLLYYLVNTNKWFDVILDQNPKTQIFRLLEYRTTIVSEFKNPLTIAPKQYFKNFNKNFIYI